MGVTQNTSSNLHFSGLTRSEGCLLVTQCVTGLDLAPPTTPVIGKISYFTVSSLVSPSIMTASSTNLRVLTLCMLYNS